MKFGAGECAAIVTTSTNRVEYPIKNEEYDKNTCDIIYWRSLIAGGWRSTDLPIESIKIVKHIQLIHGARALY